MGFNVRILDSVNARAVDPGIVLRWREGVDITLADLIRERVRLEVEKHVDAPHGLPPEHPLVSWTSGPDAEQRLEERIFAAQTAALEGFSRNAFFVVVDGTQVEELLAPLRLTPTSTVRFIRLMPLVGG